jgi:flagellar basal body L-ring protein FlgH
VFTTLVALLPIVAIGMMSPTSLYAQRVGSDGSLFTDIKAARVGDLLTVLVYEDAQASNSSQLKTEEKSDIPSTGGVSAEIYTTVLDNANNNKYDGKGKIAAPVCLGKMTVEVMLTQQRISIQACAVINLTIRR